MRERADDQPGNHRTVGFHVDVHGAVIADVRVRHHHELAVVRRVGHDFLVPRHAGVKA
jgi:hypothetical protein